METSGSSIESQAQCLKSNTNSNLFALKTSIFYYYIDTVIRFGFVVGEIVLLKGNWRSCCLALCSCC